VRVTLGRLVELLTSAARPAVLALFVGLALAAGVLEAAVIVVVVAIAASLADGSERLDLSLGGFDLTMTSGQGVVVGLGLTVLLVACAVPTAWLEARMAARVLTRLRGRLFRALTAASWERQSAVVEARFQDLAAVHAFRVANLVMIAAAFLANALGLLALIAAAFVIDVVTASTLAVIVVVLALVFRPLVQTVRRRSETHVSAHHEYVERLSDSFNVLPEIRVFGVRAAAAEELDRANERTAGEYRHMMFGGMLLPALYVGATSALLLAGLAVAGTQDDLSLVRVGAIIVFLLRALRYSQQVQTRWQAIQEHLPYLNRVEDTLESWQPAPGELGRRHLERVGTLELRDVTYEYPTGEVGIQGLDLTIEAGEIIGLDGPSGAGKSTIAQLLLGLRRPTSGTYLVDGVPVAEFDEASWFSRFAYVAQDSRLIRGDVRDNVRFLRPDVSDEDVDRALELAGISGDVARWSDGAGRAVGPSGRELSGGQRQRIAIARALAGDPDVLVMDEPTSALDRESEEIIRSTVAALRGRITVVVIAHRESTLSVCDRILTVRHNRVEERTVRPTALDG